MRNFKDCAIDMICPSCGIDLGPHNNTRLKMIKEFVYTTEYPILGKTSDGYILDNHKSLTTDDYVYDSYFECDNCGAELAPDFVDLLLDKWTELDAEVTQEIDEEFKANVG